MLLYDYFNRCIFQAKTARVYTDGGAPDLSSANHYEISRSFLYLAPNSKSSTKCPRGEKETEPEWGGGGGCWLGLREAAALNKRQNGEEVRVKGRSCTIKLHAL